MPISRALDVVAKFEDRRSGEKGALGRDVSDAIRAAVVDALSPTIVDPEADYCPWCLGVARDVQPELTPLDPLEPRANAVSVCPKCGPLHRDTDCVSGTVLIRFLSVLRRNAGVS